MNDLINNESKSRKIALAIFLVLLALLVISRSIYLERDLPPGVVNPYITIDELYYTMPAFNLYHYGEILHNIVPFIEEDSLPINILENIITFFSLSLFGNNYYGLRAASVFAALFTFIFLYLILKRIMNDAAGDFGHCNVNICMKNNFALFFLLIYMLCDFSFLLAGRVAEPTIFRMLALVVLIYISSRPFLAGKLESKWYSMLIGFLSLAAVVFVYIYNAFIFAAFAVSVSIWAHKAGRKNAIKQSAFFLLGSLLCLLTYEVFSEVFYKSSIIEVYKNMVPFQARMGISLSPFARIESYVMNIVFLFVTNLFRFNLITLFMFLISLPVFFHKIRAERNNFDILILNLMIFLLLQSIVINDYPLRKLIIMLPLVIIILAISYQNLGRYLADSQSTVLGTRFIYRYWLYACILTLAVSALYLSPVLTADFVSLPRYFMYLNLAVFLTVGLIVALKYLFEVRIHRVGIMVALILVLVPNLYLDSKYVFFNRTFHFRDAMIAMSEKVDGKIIAGGCSYGFRLYNKSTPVLDFYGYGYGSGSDPVLQYNTNFDQIFAQEIGDYSIAYTQEKPDSPIGKTYMNQHGLQLEEEYGLGEVLGTNIGLYSFTSK